MATPRTEGRWPFHRLLACACWSSAFFFSARPLRPPWPGRSRRPGGSRRTASAARRSRPPWPAAARPPRPTGRSSPRRRAKDLAELVGKLDRRDIGVVERPAAQERGERDVAQETSQPGGDGPAADQENISVHWARFSRIRSGAEIGRCGGEPIPPPPARSPGAGRQSGPSAFFRLRLALGLRRPALGSRRPLLRGLGPSAGRLARPSGRSALPAGGGGRFSSIFGGFGAASGLAGFSAAGGFSSSLGRVRRSLGLGGLLDRPARFSSTFAAWARLLAWQASRAGPASPRLSAARVPWLRLDVSVGRRRLGGLAGGLRRHDALALEFAGALGRRDRRLALDSWTRTARLSCSEARA